MLRIYSSEYNRQNSAFGTFSVCKKTNDEIKNTMFLLNMIGRKDFATLMFEQSPKEGKKTSYLKKQIFQAEKTANAKVLRQNAWNV